ncbi:MAG: FHA domain-containing protein [Acidimicrobiia bacterium]|nr:FHA domain-containing protein [Acidimicrobiia bacterium]
METIPPAEESDPTETIEFSAGVRPPEADEAPAGGYSLIVASGPRQGLHWPLENGLEAGRGPEAAIFLDDVSVSRRHCLFLLGDGKLEVRDLGSTNGTYVNGTRCDQAELKPGDHVFIGRFHLIVARDA